MYALGDAAASTGEYDAWVSFVTTNGGQVVPYPLPNLGHVLLIGRVGVKDPLAQGLPSGAYPFDTIYPNDGTALNPIFDGAPDGWSTDSGTGYFLAPKAALTDYFEINNLAAPTSSEFTSIIKYGAFAVAALLLMDALSFVPRGRS